jgi:hypothetical protein
MKRHGSNPRISESCAARRVCFHGAGRAGLVTPPRLVLQERYGRAAAPARGRFEGRASFGAQTATLSPGATSNKARKLLMHKDLGKYVGTKAVIGTLGASDSWLLAPDFCPGVKRSRNLLDGQGVENLTRDHGWLTEGFSRDGKLTTALGACLRKQAPCLRKRPRVETASNRDE